MASLLKTIASDANRRMLIMLPGATHSARDLMEQGMVEAVRMRDLDVDCAAMDTWCALWSLLLDRGALSGEAESRASAVHQAVR